MQKFETLRQPLLWFWIAVVRTRKKKKLPKIVATFVYASSQGQRTHSARTNISAPLGPIFPLAHRLRKLDRSLVPHRHKRKFPGAHVCRVTFKHLPQPLRSHIRSFRTLGQFFKIPPLSAQICHSAGGRGGPRNLFCIGILIFLWLAHAKFRNPCCLLSGRQVRTSEERRKIMPSIVAIYVYASSQGHRTHSAQTSDNYNISVCRVIRGECNTGKIYQFHNCQAHPSKANQSRGKYTLGGPIFTKNFSKVSSQPLYLLIYIQKNCM
jgi:hypothetical protein